MSFRVEHSRGSAAAFHHRALPDPDRYQTVYATRPGSVAAPTAGLHLDVALLEKCVAAGATVARVELAVGLDTFRPVEGTLEDHVMHSERFSVPPETLGELMHEVPTLDRELRRVVRSRMYAPVEST